MSEGQLQRPAGLPSKSHMRSSKSRSRGNKNRNLRPTGGNIVNRVFDSSGPDGKVRGTPAQIIEKYTQLHRDAQLSGDRVGAENFAQHAEHYTRMLAEAQREIDRAREEQEQFNRERQAERDREMQREREIRAERDRERETQRQGERSDRDRERDRERDRDRDRERERERQRQRAAEQPTPPVETASGDAVVELPAFLTHGFAQSASSVEESGLGPVETEPAQDSGLVETPEMREEPRPARSPRAPKAERPVVDETAAAAPAPRPARTRKPRAKPESEGNGTPPAEAAE
jgi:hypothetical protein